MIRKCRFFAADFETTVYEAQEETSVWLSGYCELFTDDIKIYRNIEDFMKSIFRNKANSVIYFHNLKFDGSFILHYLIDKGYKSAIIKSKNDRGGYDYVKRDSYKIVNHSYIYNISSMGQFYNIFVRHGNHLYEFRDSVKLLPFKLSKIADDFMLEHRKLEMDYEDCFTEELRDDQLSYFRNDIFILKEALEIMFKKGYDKLTIGSCCLSEFKKQLKSEFYDMNKILPNIYEIKFPGDEFETFGDYIKTFYRGAWCYLVEGKENIVYKNGLTLDVNSLYPSMMSGESGNYYPIGKPTFWRGDIPDVAREKYFFVRVKTRFYLKDGYLPFIQLKNSFRFQQNKYLKTSDYYDSNTGKYYKYFKNLDGTLNDTRVILTFTMTDYVLFLEHYSVEDFEILDGCYFDCILGLFDEYINKYRKIKENSRGVNRSLAKLFLNNLYGKMATSTNSSFKIVKKDDGVLKFDMQYENEKTPGYIPIGTAITSYARNFTIRAAQKNFYGKNLPGFIYADTDSIHIDLPIDKIRGVNIHPTNFLNWSIESRWDSGIFVRQKTYIEFDGYNYQITACGMTDKCKQLIKYCLSKEVIDISEWNKLKDNEKFYIMKNFFSFDLYKFKKGLEVPGKLVQKQIKGGALLVNTTFKIK